MREHAAGHAGLNGSGAGYSGPSLPEAAPAEADRRPAASGASALEAIMADPSRRTALRQRVTETGESLRSIARSLGLRDETFRQRIRREGWSRPAVAPRMPAGDGRGGTRRLATTMADAELVRGRMLRAVDRQVEIIDARLTSREAELDERDSRVLGNLAKTLGVLIQIGEGGNNAKDTEPPERDDVEDRLAERIKKWARGGE